MVQNECEPWKLRNLQSEYAMVWIYVVTIFSDGVNNALSGLRVLDKTEKGKKMLIVQKQCDM